MIVADAMVRDVTTVREETSLEDLGELFQIRNIHGAPVVDEKGVLLGIVTQEDVVYGAMGIGSPSKDHRDIPAIVEGAGQATPPESQPTLVSEIMTSPAIHVEEDASLQEACKLMWTLRIHRLPVVRDGRVSGILSSMDVVRVMASELAPLEG